MAKNSCSTTAPASFSGSSRYILHAEASSQDNAHVLRKHVVELSWLYQVL
jgi:hypothetical protein